jgi:hypothetical protein
LGLGEFILEFAQIFLAILSALLAVGLRLFAPFAIAVAIDRNLAQRISYPFAWSAAVFTLITPLVSHILGLAVSPQEIWRSKSLRRQRASSRSTRMARSRAIRT